MKHISSGEKNILADISLSHASDRDVLAGIFQHMDTVGDWNLKLCVRNENPLTAATVLSAPDDGIDGFIVSKAEPDELLEALAVSPLPVVTLGFGQSAFRSPPTRVMSIHNDYANIGKMGAEHLMSKGAFSTFAFIGEDWSVPRADAFRRAVEARGKNALSLIRPVINDASVGEISRFLSAIPKPFGIMAACDRVAMRVIDACESARILIPEHAVVLGVDNDEFLCSHARPPLSSILPGHREMGLRAAAELDRLISGTPRGKITAVTIHPVKLVERESTAAVPPAAALVGRARTFIRQNACSGITVKDVVAHLHVSRRLAEIRYKAIFGKTLHAEIEEMRLAKVQRLLRSTKRSVSAIAADCGFGDPKNLAHLFRKRFGLTASEFRRGKQAKGRIDTA